MNFNIMKTVHEYNDKTLYINLKKHTAMSQSTNLPWTIS